MTSHRTYDPQGPGPEPTPTGPNLITENGFETGLSGWQRGGTGDWKTLTSEEPQPSNPTRDREGPEPATIPSLMAAASEVEARLASIDADLDELELSQEVDREARTAEAAALAQRMTVLEARLGGLDLSRALPPIHISPIAVSEGATGGGNLTERHADDAATTRENPPASRQVDPERSEPPAEAPAGLHGPDKGGTSDRTPLLREVNGWATGLRAMLAGVGRINPLPLDAYSIQKIADLLDHLAEELIAQDRRLFDQGRLLRGTQRDNETLERDRDEQRQRADLAESRERYWRAKALDSEEFDITKPIDVRQDALLAMDVLDRFADDQGPFTRKDAGRMVGTIRRLLHDHDMHRDANGDIAKDAEHEIAEAKAELATAVDNLARAEDAMLGNARQRDEALSALATVKAEREELGLTCQAVEERLATALLTVPDDWAKSGHRSREDYAQDMIGVGADLMERIADVTKGALLNGWAPADGPGEIVSDLLDMVEEARGEVARATERTVQAEERAARWERVLRTMLGDVGEGNLDCILKRRPGEPMFVILGRDPDGWRMVQLWAERRADAGGDAEHCVAVMRAAAEMRRYAENPDNASESGPDRSAYPPMDARIYSDEDRNRARDAVFSRYYDPAKPPAQKVTATTGDLVDTVAEALGMRRAGA
jgi:hypothetical protein